MDDPKKPNNKSNRVSSNKTRIKTARKTSSGAYVYPSNRVSSNKTRIKTYTTKH